MDATQAVADHRVLDRFRQTLLPWQLVDGSSAGYLTVHPAAPACH